jgi:hypothetical protein
MPRVLTYRDTAIARNGSVEVSYSASKVNPRKRAIESDHVEPSIRRQKPKGGIQKLRGLRIKLVNSSIQINIGRWLFP